MAVYKSEIAIIIKITPMNFISYEIENLMNLGHISHHSNDKVKPSLPNTMRRQSTIKGQRFNRRP